MVSVAVCRLYGRRFFLFQKETGEAQMNKHESGKAVLVRGFAKFSGPGG